MPRRPRPTGKRATRYSGKRSGLEQKVQRAIKGSGYLYEGYKLKYTTTHTYTPDWASVPKKGLPRILVEVKSFFRAGDSKKYDSIARECREKGHVYIFCWENPHRKTPGAKHQTYADWCDKRGIPWCTVPELKTVLELLRDQTKDGVFSQPDEAGRIAGQVQELRLLSEEGVES